MATASENRHRANTEIKQTKVNTNTPGNHPTTLNTKLKMLLSRLDSKLGNVYLPIGDSYPGEQRPHRGDSAEKVGPDPEGMHGVRQGYVT